MPGKAGTSLLVLVISLGRGVPSRRAPIARPGALRRLFALSRFLSARTPMAARRRLPHRSLAALHILLGRSPVVLGCPLATRRRSGAASLGPARAGRRPVPRVSPGVRSERRRVSVSGRLTSRNVRLMGTGNTGLPARQMPASRVGARCGKGRPADIGLPATHGRRYGGSIAGLPPSAQDRSRLDRGRPLTRHGCRPLARRRCRSAWRSNGLSGIRKSADASMALVHRLS